MPSGPNNAHFHVGAPGIAGPTVVNVAFPAGISNDYNLSGSATAANLPVRADPEHRPSGSDTGGALGVRADQGIRSWDDFLQALLGGQTYLNVHSAVNPGGEIGG